MQKYLLINHLLISKTKVICISIIFYSSFTSRMCKSKIKAHFKLSCFILKKDTIQFLNTFFSNIVEELIASIAAHFPVQTFVIICPE